MILEFTQAFGSWKVGDITDTVSEGTGRALIAEGTAKESTEGAQLRALVKAESDRTRTETLELTRSLLTGNKGDAKGPPNGGGKVDFAKLERTSGPEDRGTDGKEVKRSFGEFCKCVAITQSVDAPEHIRTWAIGKLRNSYGADKCDYVINEETGEILQTLTRTLDYGVETITRTGTESLGGGPTYGFALKPAYMDTLFQLPMEQSVFANGAFSVPVGQALELKWPALDQYQAPQTVAGLRQSAVFAGFTLSYQGEVSPRVASDGKLTDINFKILDLTGFTDLSRDLIADNYIAMDAMATQVFGKAFVWMEDWVAINGTGNGMPEGFLNSAALITVARVGPGTTAHIEYENIVGMMAKLHPMCWGGARWLSNVTAMPDLVAVKNHAGALVYQPNTLISQVQGPTVTSDFSSSGGTYRAQGNLMGFPIYFTEKVPALGSAGDLNLVCPSQYGIARRAGLEVGLSEHFYFNTDRIAYRFKMRHDGHSLWRAPYTQADGSSTQVGPFVTLSV